MNKGDLVTNQQIKNEFGGSSQGGMRPSRTTHSLVLITGTSGSVYVDTWNDGLLKYTGTGRLGDQKMAGANKVLAESTKAGIGVYLFTAEGKNKYRYGGEVRLVGRPSQGRQPDGAGHMRSVYVFTLRPVSFPVTGLPEENLEEEPSPADQSSVNIAVSAADNERELWAAIAKVEQEARDKGPKYYKRIARAIERSRRVACLVKGRDKYRCQICGAEGFPKSGGGLYAEAHHNELVSDLGLDAPSNMICVCPMCHRVLHYGTPGTLASRRAGKT